MSIANQSARINFRTDAQTKHEAEQLFHELGLDLSTALNLFLKQAIREQGLPIHPTLDLPTKTTRDAIEHTRSIINGQTPDDGATFTNAEDAIDFLEKLT